MGFEPEHPSEAWIKRGFGRQARAQEFILSTGADVRLPYSHNYNFTNCSHACCFVHYAVIITPVREGCPSG